MQVHLGLSSRSPKDGAGTLATVKSTDSFNEAVLALAAACPSPADESACKAAVMIAQSLVNSSRTLTADVVTQGARTMLSSWFQNPAGPAGYFNFLDKEHVGYLNAAELPGPSLDFLDTNADGHASRAEVRTFLRGAAVLAQHLPALLPSSEGTPLTVMLQLANSVMLSSSVGTGPESNPLAAVATSLKQSCPPPASTATCDKAIALAGLVENLTSGISPHEIVFTASVVLSPWAWFHHSGGPSEFFNAADTSRDGGLSATELQAALGVDAVDFLGVIDELMKLIDVDGDGKASREECKSYLKGCALLIHRLPMLHPASGKESLARMLDLADSVSGLTVKLKHAGLGTPVRLACMLVFVAVAMISSYHFFHHWAGHSQRDEKLDKYFYEDEGASSSAMYKRTRGVSTQDQLTYAESR